MKAPDANDIIRTEGAEGLRNRFDAANYEAELSEPFHSFYSDASWAQQPIEASPVELEIIDPTMWEGRTVPEREWHVEPIIPHRTVTLLSSDGATGKSLLALQLCVSTAIEKPWIGKIIKPGRALFLTAEDERDEAQRRLDAICLSEGASFSDLGNLRIAPLAGLDAVLAVPAGKGSTLAGTPLWTALVARCEAFRPRLLVLDTAADLFAGNEIDRSQVRQFIGMLRGLAMRLDMTVVLLSHPSRSGLSDGSGASGSTAWNNSVRSRVYFRRVIKDNEEPDPDLRILETKKARAFSGYSESEGFRSVP